MSYFSSFLVVASCGNRTLQYVNSKIWILTFKLNINKGWSMGVAPSMHSIFWRSLAMHLHLGR